MKLEQWKARQFEVNSIQCRDLILEGSVHTETMTVSVFSFLGDDTCGPFTTLDAVVVHRGRYVAFHHRVQRCYDRASLVRQARRFAKAVKHECRGRM